jgi:hypothetical protein
VAGIMVAIMRKDEIYEALKEAAATVNVVEDFDLEEVRW